MCTDIDRIAELAKEDPKRQFYSIAHLITVEKLYEAFRSLRKRQLPTDHDYAVPARSIRKARSDRRGANLMPGSKPFPNPG